MRRIIAILLVALLAMRALVGDAMAYEMTRAMSDAQPSVASMETAPAASSMPCHTVASDESSYAVQPSCTTCQVCNMSAFLPVNLLHVAQALPSEMPVSRAAAWCSFDNALVSKPPIL